MHVVLRQDQLVVTSRPLQVTLKLQVQRPDSSSTAKCARGHMVQPNSNCECSYCSSSAPLALWCVQKTTDSRPLIVPPPPSLPPFTADMCPTILCLQCPAPLRTPSAVFRLPCPRLASKLGESEENVPSPLKKPRVRAIRGTRMVYTVLLGPLLGRCGNLAPGAPPSV